MYTFLESTFNVEIKEIARLQGFSSAYSLLYSDQHLLDFVQLDSKDPNLIAIKQMAAFYLTNGTWTIKPGIQYEVDSLMLALRQTQHAETAAVPDGAMLVSADILSSFPWLKALILLCQNSILSKGRSDLLFLSSFIENVANNLTKSSNHNRYSNLIKEFAFIL